MALTLNGTTGIVQNNFALGVGNTGPCFSAVPTVASTLINSGTTKVTFNSEEYDIGSCFDTTLSRFTPNVAGYYHISANVMVGNPLTQPSGLVYLQLLKNNAAFKSGQSVQVNSANTYVFPIMSVDLYLNGTTDYVEIVVYHNTGASLTTTANPTWNYFQGHMIRAA